jgi:GldM C-terminal domain
MFMKVIAASIILLAFLQTKTGQLAVVVENERENILQKGVENPLCVLIEKTSKEAIFLSTDNGKITNAGGNRFIIVPTKQGLAKINVYKLVKNDTIAIDTREFRVKGFPPPVARIGAVKSGIMKKEFLVSQGGLYAILENSDFQAPFQVMEYTIMLIRDNKTFEINKNTGARYNDQSIELLKQTVKNDRVIIFGIVSKGPDGELQHPQPLEFIIEE